ncbi:ATP-binding protein [Pyruvatibacter sp.]|uniref:ATP-binding protein n=1 Tax=Pyruvatibacter sp. TaxID=1981328 RepID=UPI0032EF6131
MTRQIDQLIERRAPVTSSAKCHEVYEIFMHDPDAMCVAVVDDGLVAGMVNRQDFVLRYSYQFGPDLYGRRPISHLMDPSPLIVDTDVAFDTLTGRIGGARASDLLRSFVVVENGIYCGVGTALTLLRMMLDVSEHRLAALEIERHRAEVANGAKTQFLASMSHELRTPLNAIIGFTDFMATEPFGPVSPPRYGEYVKDVNASANHLLGLINELLDMAKIESGHIDLCEEEFPASRPILDALNMLKQSIADAGLTLETRLPDGDVTLYADERMARQVVLNLLSNAIKFTPAGGTICVTASSNTHAASLTVADTGIGIPADRIETVLEPFEQVENAMSRTRPGTGLGLPLARAMMQAHGGSLEIQSVLAEGTQVTVSLPRERIVSYGARALQPAVA